MPAHHPRPTRLLSVEGLIGSGKSTVAGVLADLLRARGLAVRHVPEGSQDDPADVDEAAYDLPLDEHVRVRTERWRAFVARAAAGEEVWVLDCSLVQNPVTIAHVRDDAPLARVRGFVAALVDDAAPLAPVVVHLRRQDPAAAFERAVAERPREWLDAVVAYYAGGAVGRRLGADGVPGTVRVLAERAAVEERVLADLPARVVRLTTVPDGIDAVLPRLVALADDVAAGWRAASPAAVPADPRG